MFRKRDRSELEDFGDILQPTEAQEPILAPPVRAALTEWLTEIWAEKELKAVDLTPRRRALFTGVPGTGKTTLAHHFAARLGLPMLVVRPERFKTAYVHDSAASIGKLFHLVRQEESPVFLFMDEFDSVASKRMDSGKNPVGEQDHNETINALLKSLDAHTGYVVAATNFASRIDDAVWRRFEIQIDLETPGHGERRRILRRYFAPFVLPDRALDALSLSLETATPALMRSFCEHVKRQIVVGPKANWEMSSQAVFARVVSSVQPHPDAGKPRLWSLGINDPGLASVPWPLAKSLSDYPNEEKGVEQPDPRGSNVTQLPTRKREGNSDG